MSQELVFQIGLSLIKGIGPITAKKLIAYCGGSEAVFKEKISILKTIPNIGNVLAEEIQNSSVLIRAEEELNFISKHNILCLSYSEPNYPEKLKQCVDAPILLFSKGNTDFTNKRTISIVGTRRATNYGLSMCRELIRDLAPYSPLVISGLAYGIDSCAHKEALKNGLQTLGVLAHGLDELYPKTNRNLASEMIANGGLMTEFLSKSKLIKENFVRRNRIVAGMADITIVIESKLKGGAMITARLANSYNREVFAIPARLNDIHSKGCLHLIKNNQAMVYTGIDDIIENISWQTNKLSNQQLTFDFTKDEKTIYDLIVKYKELHIDKISQKTNVSSSNLAEILMKLELEGAINSEPGNIYSV